MKPRMSQWFSLSPKAQEKRIFHSSSQATGVHSYSREDQPCCWPSHPSTDWVNPTHIGKNNLLSSVCWSHLATASQPCQNTVWPGVWAPLNQGAYRRERRGGRDREGRESWAEIEELVPCRKDMGHQPCQLHLRPGLLWGHHTFQHSDVVLDEWLCICTKSPQSCLTLCNPMDCSPSGSSVHGILQGRMLACIAIPSSRGSSQPRDWTCVSYVSCIGRQILYLWCHLGSPW